MIKRNDKKTCFDCKNKIVITEKDHHDLGGDETVEYECIESKVKYSFLANNNFDYENMAKKCEYFEPKEYKYNCLMCMNTFKFKQPNWPYWTDEYNGEPLCSQKCVDEYNKESEKRIEYNPSSENEDEIEIEITDKDKIDDKELEGIYNNFKNEEG